MPTIRPTTSGQTAARGATNTSQKPAVTADAKGSRETKAADAFEPTTGGPTAKAAFDPAKISRDVLAKLALRPDAYTHYEERVAKRVGELSQLLAGAAATAKAGAGPVPELVKRFPGATIDVAMAASCFEHESIQYLVTEKGAKSARKFVLTPAGKLIADREASDAILARVRFKDGKASFSPVTYKRRIPVFQSPPFAPGREVDVASRSNVRTGKLVGVDDKGRWTIELTTASGSTSRKTLDALEVLNFNASHEFSLRGGTYSEVDLDVDRDAHLKKFLDEAMAIASPILEGAGKDTASQVAAQKKAIEALMAHVERYLEYPSTPEYGGGDIPANDPRSIRFNELQAQTEGQFGATFPFGELLAIRAGQCRHRAIAMQACLQVAGIDSRLTSGGAFTSAGVYRGPHAWLETTLADGTRYLTDPQWGDPFLPLKETYAQDVRRQENPNKTAYYDGHLIY